CDLLIAEDPFPELRLGGLCDVVFGRQTIPPRGQLERARDRDGLEELAPRRGDGERELALERLVHGAHAIDERLLALDRLLPHGGPRLRIRGSRELAPRRLVMLEQPVPELRLARLEALPPPDRHLESDVVTPQSSRRHRARARPEQEPTHTPKRT